MFTVHFLDKKADRENEIVHLNSFISQGEKLICNNDNPSTLNTSEFCFFQSHLHFCLQ